MNKTSKEVLVVDDQEDVSEVFYGYQLDIERKIADQAQLLKQKERELTAHLLTNYLLTDSLLTPFRQILSYQSRCSLPLTFLYFAVVLKLWWPRCS